MLENLRFVVLFSLVLMVAIPFLRRYHEGEVGVRRALQIMALIMGAGLVLLAAWLGWQEYRGQRGNDIHAHADGTVHEHFRGSAPHAHPTAIERYDSWLTRVLGPAEADRS